MIDKQVYYQLICLLYHKKLDWMQDKTSELETKQLLQLIKVCLRTLGNYQPKPNWTRDLNENESFYQNTC